MGHMRGISLGMMGKIAGVQNPIRVFSPPANVPHGTQALPKMWQVSFPQKKTRYRLQGPTLDFDPKAHTIFRKCCVRTMELYITAASKPWSILVYTKSFTSNDVYNTMSSNKSTSWRKQSSNTFGGILDICNYASTLSSPKHCCWYTLSLPESRAPHDLWLYGDQSVCITIWDITQGP